jgi:hypothetical protein
VSTAASSAVRQGFEDRAGGVAGHELHAAASLGFDLPQRQGAFGDFASMRASAWASSVSSCAWICARVSAEMRFASARASASALS